MAYLCRYGRPSWNVLDMTLSDLAEYDRALVSWLEAESRAVRG